MKCFFSLRQTKLEPNCAQTEYDGTAKAPAEAQKNCFNLLRRNRKIIFYVVSGKLECCARAKSKKTDEIWISQFIQKADYSPTSGSAYVSGGEESIYSGLVLAIWPIFNTSSFY